MPNPPGTGLRLSVVAVVFSGFFALITVPFYSPLLLVAPLALIAFMPAAERLDKHWPAYRTVTFYLTLGAFGFSIAFTVLTFDLLNGVLTLVVLIQGYTLLHCKEERNYYHLLLMAFFMLLTASVQQPEPEVALAMLLFLLGTCGAMVFLRREVERYEARETSRPDYVGLDEAAPRDLPTAKRDVAAGGFITLMALFVVGLTVVFFLFTPRIEAGLLGRNSAPIMETGIPSTVDVSTGGLISENRTPVMRVQFPDEPDGQFGGEMYWRVTSMSRYLEASWTRRGLRNNLLPDVPDLFPHEMMFSRDNPDNVDRAARPNYEAVRYIAYVDQVPEEGLPVLDFVREVSLLGSGNAASIGWDGDRDFTVRFTARGARRINYEAVSEVGRPAPAALRMDLGDYGYINERDYELLTHHDLAPETQLLVDNVVGDATTVYDQAIAIEQYLSGPDFVYTLDTPTLDPANAIDMFLTEVRAGHCEIYATAMALMLRYLGVPARVAMGYRGGDWNATDSSYTVRESMAHLWVEVLFPDHGWITFDPSPRPEQIDRNAIEQVAFNISEFILRAKMMWYRDVVGYEQGPQLSQLRQAIAGVFPDLGIGSGGGGDHSHQPLESMGPQRGMFAWLAAGLFLLVALIALRRHRETAGQWQPNADQARAIKLYQRLRMQLSRKGVPVGRRTAEELLAEAQQLPDIDQALVAEVIEAYNKVRFGGYPMPPERLQTLLGGVKRLQQQLRVRRLEGSGHATGR